MKKKILVLLTIVSIITLCAFTPSGRTKQNASSFTLIKSSPTVSINYPSDFTRYLFIKFKKANQQLKKPTFQQKPYSTYYWWDFNGNMIQQYDPGYYSLDGDQFPDCAAVSGSVYCEIRAPADYDYPDQPALQYINGSRYRPL